MNKGTTVGFTRSDDERTHRITSGSSPRRDAVIAALVAHPLVTTVWYSVPPWDRRVPIK